MLFFVLTKPRLTNILLMCDLWFATFWIYKPIRLCGETGIFIAILFKQKKGFLSKRFPVCVDNKGRIKDREKLLKSWSFIN